MLYDNPEALAKAISELPAEQIQAILIRFQCCNWSDDIHGDLEDAIKEVTQ